MKKVTVSKIRTLSKPGRYPAGETLFLNIAPGGSKSWVQRITIDGKRHDIGLGGFPVVGLAAARDQAYENRRTVRQGGDPLTAKRRRNMPTLREAAELTFAANKHRFRNAKSGGNWLQQLERHVFPSLGDRRIDQIDRIDLLDVLKPIWTAKPETGRKIRQRLRATLGWAEAHGFLDRNLAGEAISGALPAQPAVKAHYRALPFQEVGAALETVEASRASLAAKGCLRFVVLTACRSGEARGALWSEIDRDAREWRIPSERMKTGVEHRVPLADAAMDVLEAMEPLRDDDSAGLVFPSAARPGRSMSDVTLMKVLRDNGLAGRATVHGFRTCFRTWASESTNADFSVMELSLAHSVGSAVERAYARSDLLSKRRRLMEQWALFVTGGKADVVQLHG